MLLGFVYLFKGQHEEAIAEGTKAMTLDPNEADSYAILGQILNYAERPKEAVEVWWRKECASIPICQLTTYPC
jgi:hypothetical protein